MISFTDRKSASEYAEEKEAQGYDVKIRQSGDVWTVDLSQDRKDNTDDSVKRLADLLHNDKPEETRGRKAIRHMGTGITNIAKAMVNPEDSEKKRMKISRVGRPQIGAYDDNESHKINFSYIKNGSKEDNIHSKPNTNKLKGNFGRDLCRHD